MIALGCVTLICVALIAVLAYVLRSQREERAQNAIERRELLERIQRPELRPVVAGAEPLEIPERPPSEWPVVGQVQSISDEFGFGDD